MNHSYAQRCQRHAIELIVRGHNPRDADFDTLLCQRLRLFGMRTELRRIELQGGEFRTIEVWHGTNKVVPEWYNKF